MLPKCLAIAARAAATRPTMGRERTHRDCHSWPPHGATCSLYGENSDKEPITATSKEQEAVQLDACANIIPCRRPIETYALHQNEVVQCQCRVLCRIIVDIDNADLKADSASDAAIAIIIERTSRRIIGNALVCRGEGSRQR